MIKLNITMTGKSYDPKDTWRIFADETHTFEDVRTAREFLRDRYGKSKRQPMYQDTKDGKTHKVGYIYGFRNADHSHYPVERWLQQDWVNFSEEKPVYLNDHSGQGFFVPESVT